MSSFSDSLRRGFAVLTLAASAFALPALAAPYDYTDNWYAGPTEAGWGVNFTQTDNFIFATLFIYGPEQPRGQPTWYTAQLTWVQGYSRRESVTRYDPNSGAAYTTWQDVAVPATMDTTAVVNYQTDVWATGPQARMVWSGASQTTDAFSMALIQHQAEALILPEIAKAGLLPKKK